MGDSLKDQLIALGLAKPGESARKKPPRGKAAKRKRGNARGSVEPSLDEAYRLRKQAEKQAAKAKKDQKRAEDLLRRQINARVQAVVDEHALNDAAAELKRNFMYKGRIRSVLVTPEQLQALNSGELGVVFLRGSYFVMQPEHVEAVRGISPDHVPDLGGGESEEDDEYPVPDDLVW